MNTLIPVSAGAAARSPVKETAGSIWREGAILQAVVRGRKADGLTQLQIGRHLVEARGGDGLRQGQKLALEVSISRDLVMLKHVRDRPSASVRDAVRHALPRQSGQPPLLANLGLLARAPRAGNGAPQLVAVARNLLQTLPDQATVTRPEGLSRAIRDSGVFLESRLAHLSAAGATAGAASSVASGGAPGLAGDWKAALLRASATLIQLGGNASARGAPPATSQPAMPNGSPAGSGATQSAPAATQPAANARPTAASSRATPVQGQVPAPASSARPAGSSPPNVTPQGHQPLAGNAARLHAPTALTGVGTQAAASPASALATQGASPQAAIADGAVRARDAAAPPLRNSAPTAQPQAPASVSALDARGAIAELTSQLGGVLSRLTLTQLASLPPDTGAANAWIIELPVRNAQGDTDVFEFRFEREGHESEEHTEAWSVQLSFDFDTTGPVYARVTVRGNEVSTRFRAQRESTSELIRSQLDRLRSQFEDRGLEVNSLGCRTGEPPRPAAAPGGLVETKA